MSVARRVDLGGCHLHVETDGPEHAKRTIVLLHGFAASTFTWRHVMPRLATDHRVVAIDRLGFGRSDRVVRGEYSFADSVRHTVTVLDALDVERATFIGHSAGTGVAAGVALRHPDRVDGLVLISPAIVATGPPAFVRAAFAVPGVARVAPTLLRASAPLFGRALARTWASPARVTADVVDGYLQPLLAPGTAEALVEMTVGEPTARNLVARLPGIAAAATVIIGDRDRLVARGDAERVAEALGCGVVIIDDAGHVPHEEQPAATVAAIEAFLSS